MRPILRRKILGIGPLCLRFCALGSTPQHPNLNTKWPTYFCASPKAGRGSLLQSIDVIRLRIGIFSVSTQNRNVMIKPTYRDGRGVVTHLGRYMRGGAVSDRRIRYDGEAVALRYKDNEMATPKKKTGSSAESVGQEVHLGA